MIGDQIESAVIGLVASVIFLGLILSWFIRRGIVQHSREAAAPNDASRNAAVL